jgi:histidinol-phosphate phosphatase family protein
MQAIILAGGKGTRLKERLNGLPKPLIDICGIPLLERQITLLKRHGFDDILILVNHAADQIEAFCARKENWGINVRCVDDGSPRGTAGAVLSILDQLDDDVLVVYGDTMLEIDLTHFRSFHDQNRKAAATLLVHPNDHPHDSDLIGFSDDGTITEIYPYPHLPGRYYPNQVSAALYFIRRDQFRRWTSLPPPLDFGKDLFAQMVDAGQILRAYKSIEYIKDSGTPARLDKVCADLTSGRIERDSLSRQQTAVFLDRDGCINVDTGHIDSPERLELISHAAEAIRRLNRSGHRAIVVTNQPVIARGDLSFDGLTEIHRKLATELGQSGAFVDGIEVCPHHPDKGFAGERPELKIKCDCRKPATGMIDRAAATFNVDRAKSWMIGDSSSDMLAAKRAGLRSILVETGAGGHDGKYHIAPDYMAADLWEAVSFILDVHPELMGLARKAVARVQPGDVVFIGGLSRSGKSSLASAMTEALKDRDVDSTVIAMDHWILSEQDRGKTVMERYDMAAIASLLVQLTGPDPVENVQMPRYDRLTRQSTPDADTLVIPRSAVRIIEGVTALHLVAQTPPHRTHSFFVDVDESRRKSRVVREYVRRGNSPANAEAIYDARQIDETPFVLGSRSFAAQALFVPITSSQP